MKRDEDRIEDASSTLARHARTLKYEDIPEDVVAVTKKSILDTLGVSVAASSLTPGIKELVTLIKEGGGKEESSILGFGGRVPCWMAAFANGAMAHCMDYDDIYDPALVHPSSATVSAGMAMAERLGGINGKDFLTAICLGNDLVCRMGLSVQWKFDWHITPLFGIFGATLTCGKLLHFNELKFINSLGIALSQACVTMEVAYSPGSELRGMYAAFPAKGAVLSALMSEIGIAGPSQSLEGQAGLYNVYFDGKYDRGLLLDDLGKRFESGKTSFKLWPNCRDTQPHLDAALSLVHAHRIEPEEIEEVVIYVAGLGEKGTFPLEEHRNPCTTLDAKFSVPFSVAVALVKKRVGIQDFTPEGIKDLAVLKMAQKVNAKYEPSFEIKGIAPGRVDIRTGKGQTYSKHVDFPRGHPSNPATDEEIITKFRECVTLSAKPVSKTNAEGVIDLVMDLEKVADVREIMRLLC